MQSEAEAIKARMRRQQDKADNAAIEAVRVKSLYGWQESYIQERLAKGKRSRAISAQKVSRRSVKRKAIPKPKVLNLTEKLQSIPKSAHSVCNKCGLPIAWGKSKNGKPMPVNVDGTEHWDMCSEARTRANIADGKVYPQISSGVRTGILFKITECDCLPWDACDTCRM